MADEVPNAPRGAQRAGTVSSADSRIPHGSVGLTGVPLDGVVGDTYSIVYDWFHGIGWRRRVVVREHYEGTPDIGADVPGGGAV